jgi:protein-L-isoaspartate(D-aspartate) O-methyltransferase
MLAPQTPTRDRSQRAPVAYDERFRQPSAMPARRAKSTASLILLVLVVFAPLAHAAEDLYARERAAMVETVREYGRMGLTEGEVLSEKVLQVMGETKRHLFIPERYRSFSYDDRPVPIGHGQTISQPFIVALMTQLARVEPGDTVLEIGTGSGYQAAILARLAKQVCTIEIVRPLGEEAAKRLKRLGYANVRVRIGDGYKGWPDCGPFDAVVVTAALGHVPPLLIEQMKVGGRLVMPVGEPGASQTLTVVEKTGPRETKTHDFGLVRFVPFTRSKEKE